MLSRRRGPGGREEQRAASVHEARTVRGRHAARTPDILPGRRPQCVALLYLYTPEVPLARPLPLSILHFLRTPRLWKGTNAAS